MTLIGASAGYRTASAPIKVMNPTAAPFLSASAAQNHDRLVKTCIIPQYSIKYLFHSQVTSEELSRRIEEERAAIHAEYEQERIAYQKLLKDYNRQVCL